MAHAMRHEHIHVEMNAGQTPMPRAVETAETMAVTSPDKISGDRKAAICLGSLCLGRDIT